MALIQQKKRVYPLQDALRSYLTRFGRAAQLPVRYEDLLRYNTKLTLYDKLGRDTYWSTVLYAPSATEELQEGLRRMYATLKAAGDEAVMRHLYIERIDLCEYGNTFPFRVKIVNRYNENFDYFYLKKVDASRLYGLELEHLLSPNRINFAVSEATLVEEHIPGVPGEVFIQEHLTARYLDHIRVAKEFIKFNERCFIRLLGDMHKNNFVVEITPDFEETIYRIRAIDFDQQCYEGNMKVYLPQFHKENNPILKLGFGRMTPETTRQYQQEERAVMRYRIQTQQEQLSALLLAMQPEELAPAHHVKQLREQLARHYASPAFSHCSTMGQVLHQSLEMLFQ